MLIYFFWSIQQVCDLGQSRHDEIAMEHAEYKTARQAFSSSAQAPNFLYFFWCSYTFEGRRTLGGFSPYTRHMPRGEGTLPCGHKSPFRIDITATICCKPTAWQCRLWLHSESNSSCSLGKLWRHHPVHQRFCRKYPPGNLPAWWSVARYECPVSSWVAPFRKSYHESSSIKIMLLIQLLELIKSDIIYTFAFASSS